MNASMREIYSLVNNPFGTYALKNPNDEAELPQGRESDVEVASVTAIIAYK